MDLKNMIRDVPDFPKKGIIFKDITTLLKDKDAFREAVDKLAEECEEKKVDIVVAVEARGFIFGGVLAYKLGAGFVPLRKPGKLPYKTIKETYELEYGTDTLEIHEDAIKHGDNVLVIDDLLATGGTSLATVKLVEKLGGNVSKIVFLIDLRFLKGTEKLDGYEVSSLITY
ncbi:adenine phosphoribosyltransferase [bacterium]|nr:adenine phosphoribosyltransferase [bacterium]